MNRRNSILLAAGLAMIGLGGLFLARLHSGQKLGPPAVRTSPTEDVKRLAVELPASILNYTSAPMAVDKLVLDTLPKDTSFGSRIYTAPDGNRTLLNVVLMGADRTSLHKPEFCLEGQGWRIDRAASSVSSVHITRPFEYDLPVMKLISRRQITENGQTLVASGVYVYWFVAENAYTANHWQRMWWMARDMLRSGVLQRWAYVSCFAVCEPGKEDATFERMKEFIAAGTPEFQLTPAARTLTSR